MSDEPTSAARRSARFGPFHLDLATGELRRGGRTVGLQEQQTKLLRYLMERRGETVAREELHRVLWPEGTFVEFEYGLYNTVNRLRRTLRESASSPLFIETVPKKAIGSLPRSSTRPTMRRCETKR